ncbi:MAG: hypothetical protein M3P93_18115 [Actinomycetota bacterium]|nr:hypothetical protein [Actinomycetota bacterium]
MTDLLAAPRTAVATAFAVGAALRGGRFFHTRGATSTCRVQVTGGGDWGCRLLDRPGGHEGVVRLSRGAGLPRPLPDVEGLALRLPGLGSEGRPLDLLVNSAWRFVFTPASLSGTWSSILPYCTATGRRVLFGARPRPGGFALLVAPPLGAWREWGRLDLGAPVDGEDLRFWPTGGADDLEAVPLFRRLREQSYVASQAARAGADRDSPSPAARSA